MIIAEFHRVDTFNMISKEPKIQQIMEVNYIYFYSILVLY